MSRRFRVSVAFRGASDPRAAAAALAGAGSSPVADRRVPVRPQPRAGNGAEIELTYRVVTDEEVDELALEQIVESGLEGPGAGEAWLWCVAGLAEAAEVAAADLSLSASGPLAASALRVVAEPSVPRRARGI